MAFVWAAVIVTGLCTSLMHAQDERPNSGKSDQKQTTPEQNPTRVVGVIPAFNAENNIDAAPLSSSQKFHLFTKTVKDPFNLIWPAFYAVILDASGSSSGYGSGFSGVAKKYGSSLADSISGNFFRLYAFPSLLHEDPRYFRAREESVGRRVKHVFGATIITRTDEKRYRFNWSKLLASAASSGLSNAYYPAENRGAKLTLSRIGLSYFGEVCSNALKEFWPDLTNKRKKKKKQ